MGYLVVAGFHDQPLDLPYLAVGRADGQFAAYVYRAGWDGVDGDLLRGFRSAGVAGIARRPGPTVLSDHAVMSRNGSWNDAAAHAEEMDQVYAMNLLDDIPVPQGTPPALL